MEQGRTWRVLPAFRAKNHPRLYQYAEQTEQGGLVQPAELSKVAQGKLQAIFAEAFQDANATLQYADRWRGAWAGAGTGGRGRGSCGGGTTASHFGLGLIYVYVDD